MAFDRFLIAPLNEGLQLDVKPWLIADSAYEELTNAYMFRGRLKKRFGSGYTGTSLAPGLAQLSSRIRLQVQTTDGSGDRTDTVPGAIFKIGQAFSVGAEMFTVVTAGVAQPMLKTLPFISTTDSTGALTINISSLWSGPYSIGQVFIVGTETFTISALGLAALTASGTGSGTFNTATGALVISSPLNPSTSVYFETNSTGTYSTTNGAYVFSGAEATTAIYFYPGESVMGLTQWGIDTAINNKPAYAWDTQFAYVFSGAAWLSAEMPVVTTWHSTNSQFFWTCNWNAFDQVSGARQQNLFVTNYRYTAIPALTDDPIRYYNGTAWTDFYPYFAPLGGLHTGPYVSTAKLIVSFKGHMGLLAPVETNAAGTVNTPRVNRFRYSHKNDVFADNAWYESDTTDGTLYGDGGGFVDAATDEEIVSAEFIKDRLIVFFERSTWELAYTDNDLMPFLWQKLNTELGCEAEFSSVPFDQFILSVGQTGVHACNGSNVERIDTKIPDEVFKVKNETDGTKRVHGIRDYFTEMVYWCFPSTLQKNDRPYPLRVLVYNYKNHSWAFNTDCITCFGYFEQQTGLTWAAAKNAWSTYNVSWDSGTIQPRFRQIIAGNQQGYVFMVLPGRSQNEAVMQITDIALTTIGTDTLVTCTIIDHGLMSTIPGNAETDYIYIDSIQDTGIIGSTLNGKIQSITVTSKDTFEFIVDEVIITGTYRGGGTVGRVSNINIRSRQWNPYVDKGRNVFLGRVDFAVTKTSNGQITVDYSPSSASNISLIDDGTVTGAILGTNILETSPYPGNNIEAQSTRLWHPVYFQGDGECIQLFFYYSDEQIKLPAIAFDDFELQGLVLNTRASGYYLQ